MKKTFITRILAAAAAASMLVMTGACGSGADSRPGGSRAYASAEQIMRGSQQFLRDCSSFIHLMNTLER